MQLKEDQKKVAFDLKKVEASLVAENKFITDLFAKVAFPDRYDEDNDEEDEDDDLVTFSGKKPKIAGEKKSRATSIAELKNRYDEISGKKHQTYKEKMQKKGLKNRMKKKTKRDERNLKKKLVRTEKLTKPVKSEEDNVEQGPKKPVFNSEGKMVYSKFDFSGIGKEKKEKTQNDPKKILENLEKQKEKLKELEKQGDKDKAIQIKEKSMWQNALAKSKGEKVKDDVTLLKKAIKKKENQKKQSKKKWDQRKANVKQQQEDKQKKRQDNIDKKKKDKKLVKLKQAAKRGRVVPGF
ncbi:PREDICTED: surfeit locus protein 6 homolog [Nicrophorus vespilloides]|uniref:Surfeit locus protein 6 homolog n=1 Tax=Nicrophorus vespilloides TaxID=110193 RepID=A0ABM1N318_NICVS|nr:PREDICTED: surfeit locus protein 6 homolog [Nicrophorus vespilloides]